MPKVPDRPTKSKPQEEPPRLESQWRLALLPFAQVPDDPDQPDDYVLYRLARGMKYKDITCGHIRAARRALGGS